MTGTTTKGLALRADLDLYDGITLTTTRTDSTGGTLSGLRLGDEVDVLSVYGSGTNYTLNTVQSAVNAVGSAACVFRFAPGTWVIDDDISIPATIHLIIAAGAVFSISSGKTLTILGGVTSYASWFSGGASAGAVALTNDAPVDLKAFGAIGDGVTDDTAAITAALAANERAYAPPGTYLTTKFSANLVSRITGEGVIKKTGDTTHAPNLVIADSAPSSEGDGTSITTAFTGDLSKAFEPLEVRILGTTALGAPATGFKLTEELIPYYIQILNQAGHNEELGDAVGRTSAGAIRVVGTHNGQGGLLPISTQVWANQTKAGATSFLASPAAAGFNAQCNAGADGIFLNPIEVECNDQGFDAAAMGYVASGVRTVNTGAIDAVWQAFRGQAKTSTKPWDTGFIFSGVVDTFIDGTLATLTAPNNEFILMQDTHRIYGNATAGTWKRATRGTDWLGYNSGISGWEFYVGGTEILRVRDSGLQVSTGAIQVTNGNLQLLNAVNIIAIGGTTVVKLQQTGWAALTGTLDRTNFADGNATLNSQVLRALITDLKTHGLID